MKRISPAPMGRAYRVRKRSHHITIVVTAPEAKEAAAAKEKTARKVEQAPKKSGKKDAKAPKAAKEAKASATA
jgi:hypothetical protein